MNFSSQYLFKWFLGRFDDDWNMIALYLCTWYTERRHTKYLRCCKLGRRVGAGGPNEFILYSLSCLIGEESKCRCFEFEIWKCSRLFFLTDRKVRGAKVHKTGSKIPTWLTVSIKYKITPVNMTFNFFLMSL